MCAQYEVGEYSMGVCGRSDTWGRSVGRTRVRPTALLSIDDDDDDDPRGWRERRSYARARVYMAIAVVRDVAVVRVVRSMRPRSTRASA